MHTDRIRYFVVTIGRTGSSLLAAVLADAGADFGLTVPKRWDPRSGQVESRAIKKAAHHYRRAYDIGRGRKYLLSPAVETKCRLRRGRRYLAGALRASHFVKIGDLDLLIQPAFKLGYQPRVILNYRLFEATLPSLLVGRTHVGADQLCEEYVRIYRQGLMLLRTFGGCTVGYHELQDEAETRWSQALSGLTGLSETAMIDSRAQRLSGHPDPDRIAPIYASASQLFERMRELGGQVIEPSRQVLRASAPTV